MAFNNSFTAVTGATYTAAQYNTHVRDNLNAIWVYTTAGDLAYATSATTLARLGIGGAGSLLKSTGSVPAWLPGGGIGTLLYNSAANTPAWLALGSSGSILRQALDGMPGWLAAGGAGSLLKSDGSEPGWLPGGGGGTILYNSALNILAWLAIGGAGSLLKSTGSAPAWLPGGGIGTLLYNSAANTPAWLALGSAGSILRQALDGMPGWLAAGGVGSILHVPGDTIPAWLAKPSVDSLLRHTGAAAAPIWMPMTDLDLSGRLHATASVEYDAAGQNILGTTWVDVDGATVNLVTTVTCTIVAHYSGTVAAEANGGHARTRAMIGGVGQAAGWPYSSDAFYHPFGFTYIQTGVAAGTITCKMQGSGGGSSSHAIYARGNIVALAFTE